ncbi:MAG: hypothetical protein ACYCWW_13900 [Deltaproteobacteria bacterium]
MAEHTDRRLWNWVRLTPLALVWRTAWIVGARRRHRFFAWRAVWVVAVALFNHAVDPRYGAVVVVGAAVVLVALSSGILWAVDRFLEACKRAWRRGHAQATERDRHRLS